MAIDKKKLRIIFLLIGIIILILSSIELIIGLSILVDEKKEVDTYFEENNIIYFPIEVKTRDNSHISAIVFMNESMLSTNDESIPTILVVPGANNEKTKNIDKLIQPLYFGFAVIAMEQRAHGESGGYFTFYQQEPYDVSDVITYVDNNFNQLNCSHIALIGMSLGGGTAVAAQALDDRIFASSIYHPAANISDVLAKIGVGDISTLIGFFPGIQPPYDIPLGFPNWNDIMNDTWYYRDTIRLVNETNTKNLLLLHGSEDDMVDPNVSKAIVERADPLDNRDDITMVLREGIGHGANERNDISFKYTLTWFRYFYFNDSIDITDLDNEITYIELYHINFPETGAHLEHFINFGLLLIIGLYMSILLAINPPKYLKKREDVGNEEEKDSGNDSEHDEENDIESKTLVSHRTLETSNYKKIFITRSLVLISVYTLVGLYCRMRNPSIALGLLFYPSLVACPILIFIPVRRKQEIKTVLRYDDLKSWFTKQKILDFTETLIVFAVPFIVFLIIRNYGGRYTMDPVNAPEISVALHEMITFTLILALPIMFLRNLPLKYVLLSILIFIIGGIIVLLFVPLPEIALLDIPLLGFILCIVLSLIYIVIWFVFQIIRKLITRNNFATLIICSIVICVFLWMRLMRVV
ncbi:MAG: prolyl oligopeptidase family serine peptidase [Candidatus Lokiarchaeota archaeon]|nr:prolyl oligopeptidase family serine peptidase [Candidatus Lokiarchaeota archaeon]